MNKRLPEYKKVFTLDIIKEYKKEFSPNYILMIITAFLYIAILYRYGISNNFLEDILFLKDIPSITYLCLSSNPISDYSTLDNLEVYDLEV